jgi:hypothetical protein
MAAALGETRPVAGDGIGCTRLARGGSVRVVVSVPESIVVLHRRQRVRPARQRQ